MKLPGQTAHAENQNIKDEEDIPDVSLTGPVKGITDTCNRNKGIVSSNMKVPECLLAQCKNGPCWDAEVCDQQTDISLSVIGSEWLVPSHTEAVGWEGGHEKILLVCLQSLDRHMKLKSQ